MTAVYETFQKNSILVIGNTLISNFLDRLRVNQLSQMGYPKDYTERQVVSMQPNYCTAAYYLWAMKFNYCWIIWLIRKSDENNTSLDLISFLAHNLIVRFEYNLPFGYLTAYIKSWLNETCSCLDCDASHQSSFLHTVCTSW